MCSSISGTPPDELRVLKKNLVHAWKNDWWEKIPFAEMEDEPGEADAEGERGAPRVDTSGTEGIETAEGLSLKATLKKRGTEIVPNLNASRATLR